MNREHGIEDLLARAKARYPDLWQRTEAIARIIDPGAFAEGAILTDEEGHDLFEARRRYMQAVAFNRAHEVLAYLGLNEPVDWLQLLSELPPAGSPP